MITCLKNRIFSFIAFFCSLEAILCPFYFSQTGRKFITQDAFITLQIIFGIMTMLVILGLIFAVYINSKNSNQSHK